VRAPKSHGDRRPRAAEPPRRTARLKILPIHEAKKLAIVLREQGERNKKIGITLTRVGDL
jgi:hypothetical protein